MPRKCGGGYSHPSSRGGNRRKRQATLSRKRSGERGMSRYQAKQTKPYELTVQKPQQRLHRRFIGFMLAD